VAAWKFFREKFDASWLVPGTAPSGVPGARRLSFFFCFFGRGRCGRGEILAMANPWGTSQNPRFPGLLGRGANWPFHGKTLVENGTQEH